MKNDLPLHTTLQSLNKSHWLLSLYLLSSLKRNNMSNSKVTTTNIITEIWEVTADTLFCFSDGVRWWNQANETCWETLTELPFLGFSSFLLMCCWSLKQRFTAQCIHRVQRPRLKDTNQPQWFIWNNWMEYVYHKQCVWTSIWNKYSQ